MVVVQHTESSLFFNTRYFQIRLTICQCVTNIRTFELFTVKSTATIFQMKNIFKLKYQNMISSITSIQGDVAAATHIIFVPQKALDHKLLQPPLRSVTLTSKE